MSSFVIVIIIIFENENRTKSIFDQKEENFASGRT